MNRPEPPAVGQMDRILEVLNAPPLCSRLKDAVITVNAVGEGLNLADRHSARLFAIDILARRGRQERRQRMPVVAGGNQHRVDVGPRQQIEEVPILTQSLFR